MTASSGGAALSWIGPAIALGGAFVYLLTLIPGIAVSGGYGASVPWAPSLGLHLAFHLDGLALLFTLLICGVGALIFIYSGAYLAGKAGLGRFHLSLALFTVAMLGVVLSANLITLFVFWELTSITSFLLIGFHHEKDESRSAAVQALLITSGGGLALLGGFLVLGNLGGSMALPDLMASGEQVRAHPLYPATLLLILLGAFTKSAQFPFHFWLPGAMAAPTPVSAYLHSATMVKAGIYLLARLSPVLGGTDLWLLAVGGTGAVTMLAGGYLALHRTDLKQILAYSTVSALGTLTLLLGLGTEKAVQAALVFLLAHALYKGALFMVAGAVDHETGTRDVDLLGGLRGPMRWTALIAGTAAVSLAGFGPVFSFIGKEMLLEAVLTSERFRPFLVGIAVAAGALFVTVAAIVGIRPFFGPLKETPRTPHEAPGGLLLGPAVLAVAGVLGALFPAVLGQSLISPAASAVLGYAAPVKLTLWHGINPAFILSALSLAVGGALYYFWEVLRRAGSHLNRSLSLGPARAYELGYALLLRAGEWQARRLQTGYLRHYVLVSVLVFAGLTLVPLLRARSSMGSPGPIHIHELVLGCVILAGVLMTVLSGSRLGAVAALGVVGYGVALIFMFYGAPDLAMTQFLIETLTVILFVLVFHHLPPIVKRTRRSTRLRDAVVAVAAGCVMTALVIAGVEVRPRETLEGFFAEQSVPGGHGRNIVNVILVDFRGLDTLAEITVLATAAVGIYALLKLRRARKAGG